MNARIGLVLDCTDPAELAPFWSEALGYVTLGGSGSHVLLVDPERVGPQLLLQAVPEPKAGKNRMHVDIKAIDVDGEASRLEALGARRLEAGTRHELGTHWVLMADPDGNEFCVCAGGYR